MHEWGTISEFCNAVMAVGIEVQKYYKTGLDLESGNDLTPVRIAEPRMDNPAKLYAWETGARESLIAETPFLVNLIYPEKVAMIPDEAQTFTLKLTNVSTQSFKGDVALKLPEKWTATPSAFTYDLPVGGEVVLSFTVNVSDLKRRGQKNILTLRFTANGVPFLLETALPVACPWLVTDKNSGKEGVVETVSTYFGVPRGEFTYKTKLKATAKKEVRVSCGGTRPFVLYVNGVPVYEGKGDFYVPTFHRDNSWTTVSLLKNMNEIEVYFPQHEEGEFFFWTGTTFGCSTWVDTLERML